jgi:hypothetical protein
MNEHPPASTGSLGPQGNSSAEVWLRQYAHRRGIDLDAAQEQALQQFERLYEDLLGLERMDYWMVRVLDLSRVLRGL